RRLDLIYELERAGFQRMGDRWIGQITVLETSFDLVVTFPEGFPHVPPKVCWLGSEGLTWHQNADSSLCLYSGTSPGDYPWLTSHGLLDRIQEWLVGACTDWVGEPPDLDLEPYWHRSPLYDLVIHPPLDS